MGRVGNSTQRFPELNASLPKGRSAGSALETQHNAFLNSMHRSLRVALQGRVGNSTQRFPKGRVVGWELSFTEDLS
ncbi:hypothetical protein [Leptospira noguchii]|uniref:Uncharacterized protein n=1 Tax=Leptospira noguchii TaxID=28182 RepID=A0AAE9G9T2_9LEPT|nr:hypothetical protein [Leptospira noguchii]UOG56076.1 hypothetical protein MAL03_14660 [Leptospira noguchii]